MERASNRLAVLHELTSGLAERMGLQSITSFVLGVGLTAIEANRGTLCLLTPDGLSLEVVAHNGYDNDVMNSWRIFPSTRRCLLPMSFDHGHRSTCTARRNEPTAIPCSPTQAATAPVRCCR